MEIKDNYKFTQEDFCEISNVLFNGVAFYKNKNAKLKDNKIKNNKTMLKVTLPIALIALVLTILLNIMKGIEFLIILLYVLTGLLLFINFMSFLLINYYSKLCKKIKESNCCPCKLITDKRNY